MISFPSIIADLKKKQYTADATEMTSRFEQARHAYQKDLSRCVTNTMAYAGLGADQWEVSLANDMQREGRSPRTYNLLQMYVDGIAGNLLLNWVDPKFIDREDDGKDVTSALDVLQKIYYADKEHFNYKYQAMQCIVSGLIYGGCEELQIVRSPDEPRGRLRFVSHRMDMIVPDPGYLGDDFTRGGKELWKKYYMSPAEIIHFCPFAEDKVIQQMERLQQGIDHGGQKYDRVEVGSFEERKDEFGSKKLVVEHLYIKYETKYSAIDRKTGLLLPTTPYEFGSEEDYLGKQLAWESMGYQLQPEDITSTQRRYPVMYKCIFCPALGLVVDDRPDERQLVTEDGDCNLPFYLWSFIMKNGKMIGLVDIGLEAQRDINKRNNHITKIITESPIAGKMVIHPMAYGDNIQARDDMVDNASDVAKPMILDSEAPVGLTDRLVHIMPGTQVPNSLFAEENTKLDWLNRMLRLPMVLQGQSQHANQSGVLFGRQVIEANIMQMVPATSVRQHEHYKAQDWLRLGIQKYGGNTPMEREANYNRTFYSKTREPITANAITGVDENGSLMVENDLTKLQRADVIVSEAKENDYMKQAKREVDIAALQAMAPSETNFLARTCFEIDLMLGIETGDELQRQRLEEAAAISYDLARKTMQVKISQVDAALAPQQMPPQQPAGQPQVPQQTAGNSAKALQMANQMGKPATVRARAPVAPTQQMGTNI